MHLQPGWRPPITRQQSLRVMAQCPHSGCGRMRLHGQEKLQDYGPYLAELAKDGVDYRPLVWTTWGRPHADAAAAVI